eukprot:2501642-Rhodomonas_salina.1
MHTQYRAVHCLSHVVGSERQIRRYCNECKDFCEVASPHLTPAAAQLPPSVFQGCNSIPEGYDIHLRDEISQSDFDYLLKCLPLRKAPGPDGVPNELLRCLPDA